MSSVHLQDLEIGRFDSTHHSEVYEVIYQSFAESDGKGEAKIVRDLARGVLGAGDGYGFAVWQGTRIVGAIVFSKISFDDFDQELRLLSPVAVAPDIQRQGVGTALISHGLNELRHDGICGVFTYGDPNYYGRFGFQGVSIEDAKPPHPLQFEHGWQVATWGASLRFKGQARVVAAMNNPAIW